MSCGRRYDVARYHDGALDAEAAAEVAAHVAACARCARALDDLRAVSAALGSVRASTAPAGLAERLRAGVRAARADAASGVAAAAAPLVPARWLAAAATAAAAACLLATALVLTDAGAPPPSPPVAAGSGVDPIFELVLLDEPLPDDYAVRLAVYGGAPDAGRR